MLTVYNCVSMRLNGTRARTRRVRGGRSAMVDGWTDSDGSRCGWLCHCGALCICWNMQYGICGLRRGDRRGSSDVAGGCVCLCVLHCLIHS